VSSMVAATLNAGMITEIWGAEGGFAPASLPPPELRLSGGDAGWVRAGRSLVKLKCHARPRPPPLPWYIKQFRLTVGIRQVCNAGLEPAAMQQPHVGREDDGA